MNIPIDVTRSTQKCEADLFQMIYETFGFYQGTWWKHAWSRKVGKHIFFYVRPILFRERWANILWDSLGATAHRAVTNLFYSPQKCEYQKRCLFRIDVLKSRIVVAFPRYFLRNGWSGDYRYARPRACLNRARCLHHADLFYYSTIVVRSWRVLRGFRMSDTDDCQLLLEKKPTAPVLPSFLTYFNGFLSILRLFPISREMFWHGLVKDSYLTCREGKKKNNRVKQHDPNGSFAMHLYYILKTLSLFY